MNMTDDHALNNAKNWMLSIREAFDAMNGEEPEVEGEYKDLDSDSVRDRIREQPLSVTVTGEWTPGETPKADSYVILLSTGGPALRIVGDLDRWRERPDNARLEYQDWFTPWTEYPTDTDEDAALLAYASVFYFGE